MSHAERLHADIENLVIQYDEGFRLRCADLHLKGHVFAILGHNGAGKSTFIKATLGLLQPLHGSLRFTYHDDGVSIPLLPERHMAFCPENGAVFADISVESYIQLWCRIKHGNAAYYKQDGSRYIEQLHIAPLMRKLGRELSKGQRRRVQTAIGFLLEPKLFLFDEPFDGLDVQRTSELADLMSTESARMAVILSSHRMDVVERLADTVIVLREGQIEAAGPTQEVAAQLCGHTLRISGLPKPEEQADGIRQRFPHYIVNRLGTEVTVTGEGSLPETLAPLLEPYAVQTELTPPSLTDAISYHLRQVRTTVTTD
ncbi:MAG: ABC transporter ATP-binding protein [Bdellovibrionota bacterium]|nr:MAG: ABC transporter ATP-binding protein [Bdellovibrionota bacterium]